MWPSILRDARDGHRGLVWLAVACLPCAAVTIALGLFDDRLVTGAPVWNKPFKFFVSVAAYCFTFAWYLGQMRRASGRTSRLGTWLGTGVGMALAIELVLISMQAARGVTSHFNLATPFDATVFNVMGLMIMALSVFHTILWVMLLRQRWTDRARLAALRWGAGVSIAGLAIGGLMVRPSAEQIAHIRARTGWVSGAHAVGVPDGGPGLPVVNWSTDGGDRRAPHFVGLHAMQVVPAVVLLAPAAWPQATMLMAVRATGIAWGLLVMVLTLQAQQARPIVRPGTQLGAAIAVVVLGWIVAMIVAARGGAVTGTAASRQDAVH